MTLDLLLQFVAQHPLLVGLFVVLAILVLSYDRIHQQLAGLAISPQALVKLINQDNAVVLDIRPEETFHNGHIIRAINMPANQLTKDFTLLNRYKGRPLAIIGQREAEVSKIAQKLRKHNIFSMIKTLSGGMVRWEEADLPVERGKV